MSDWPLVLSFYRERQGESLALATLVQRDGSSYRQPGARMLISSDGNHQGSLSGGCLEEGIAQIGKSVICEKKSRIEVIDTRPHFGCPGTLTFLIEPIENGLLQEIDHHIQERRTFHLTSDFTGEKRSTTLFADEGEGNFIETITPRPRLVALGSTPDLDPVFEIARVLGWECHQVIQSPDEITTPLAEICVSPPVDFNQYFSPDQATAVIIMSHRLTADVGYLKQILPQGYPYVGLLGSKRRRESILNELGEAGLMENPDWVDRFFAPVGLDLGGHHPSTIALSIVSEIQAVFSSAKAGFLRDQLGSIHTAKSCPK